MKFNSQIQIRGAFHMDYETAVVKNEPMFFNSDLDFAYKQGGPLTRDFIDKLPGDWLSCNPVLDSRVHMLMPNWYPCIPGWHHDDVPRSTPTGQPNYINPEYKSEHLTGLINAEICPTTFIIGDVEVSDPDVDSKIYNRWHQEIETQSELQRIKAQSGVFIQFDCDTFHTGTRAVANGWRWFIRLSRNTDRQQHITNELRRQVQVYLEFPIEGW